MAHEVDPGRNVVDVHEQTVGSERISKSIAQPPRRARRVIPTVIDENRASHGGTSARSISMYAFYRVTEWIDMGPRAVRQSSYVRAWRLKTSAKLLHADLVAGDIVIGRKVRGGRAPTRHDLVVLGKHVLDGHVPIWKCQQQFRNERLHRGETFDRLESGRKIYEVFCKYLIE